MLHADVGRTSVQYRHTAIADLMLRGNTVAMISNLWRPAIIVVGLSVVAIVDCGQTVQDRQTSIGSRSANLFCLI